MKCLVHYALPLAALLPVFFFSSCGSVPKAESAPEPVVEETAEREAAEPVAIALPPKKNVTYFSSIDPQILEAVEIGSPASLRQAALSLRKSGQEYAENEKVLLNVMAAMAQITWPHEKLQIDTPAVTDVTPYLGAVESARQGVYDSSTGNVDFLAMALPSLVLLTSKVRTDYYSECESALKAALEKRPESVFARYLLGTLYVRMERYAEALSCFDAARTQAPDCFECAFSYAETALRCGQAEAAGGTAVSLLSQNALNVKVLGLCAEAAFSSGNYTDAETYVARILQQEPDNAYYVLFRAKILVEKGEYIKAASLLDVYARTDTASRDYLVLRSRVQKEWNRNINAATKTIEQALSKYPDDEDIILSAASLAAETGGMVGGKTAGELAEIILAKDAGNVQALKIQVASFMQKRNWAQAYKVGSALYERDKEHTQYLFIDICIESGHQDEGWKLASQLYAQNPQDEAVQQSYIKVLVATGRKTEASRLIAQLLPAAATRMKSFLFYERSFLSDSDDAVFSDLRASLTANPRNKDALFRLYSIYYRKKEYRKAQYYLKQVVALSPTDESLLALNRELDSLLAR
ncbi:MAG: tetratricopeptide repeat protein [Treponema sp.]|nr:tetratricopeptide repeat protein [Treponema sp.]